MDIVSFTYGLCAMFYALMAWFFWRKGNDRLSRLVCVLMALVAAQVVKDVVCLNDDSWSLVTAVDMVAVPLYGFILRQLVKPSTLTVRRMVMETVPFVVLPLLFVVTGIATIFFVEVAWAGFYGSFYLVWATVMIPRYNRWLREQFSYSENINLSWLRTILWTFYFILILWIVDCLIIHVNIEMLYMLGSLLMWMFICYFIYRHETVLDALQPQPAAMPDTSAVLSQIDTEVRRLFADEHLYLNPRLKLSDVARLVGTNRTYLSAYFNRDNGATFFDFVNDWRVDFAKQQLSQTDDTLYVVAERSGFNSLSTFRRAFEQRNGCTPAKWRNSHK